MSSTKTVSAAFGVNIEHLHAMGVVDPYSSQSLELYHSGKLTANERLYFSLWGSPELSTSLLKAKTRLAKEGETVSSAFFIIKGNALGLKGDEIYRLGPGSIIGLAEAVGNLPHCMTVVAVDNIQVRFIPIQGMHKLLRKMPVGLRGILKSTVMRTLQLDTPPAALL